MKSLKVLGLAAVAAWGLMAFVGAGMASATVICKTNVSPCPAAWMVSTGTEIFATLDESARLETTGPSPETLDTCTGGSVVGPTEQTGGGTETVSMKFAKEALSWSGCTHTTTTVAGGRLEFHWIAGGEITLTVAEARVTVVLGGSSCIYGYESEYKDIGAIDPPEGTRTNATATINTIVKLRFGPFPCPPELRWTAAYAVTAPNGGALWATES